MCQADGFAWWQYSEYISLAGQGLGHVAPTPLSLHARQIGVILGILGYLVYESEAAGQAFMSAGEHSLMVPIVALHSSFHLDDHCMQANHDPAEAGLLLQKCLLCLQADLLHRSCTLHSVSESLRPLEILKYYQSTSRAHAKVINNRMVCCSYHVLQLPFGPVDNSGCMIVLPVLCLHLLRLKPSSTIA